MSSKRFVRRSEKVNFMKVEGSSYSRMKFFTAMEEEKNPTEYSRQYVDESFERVDVVGISSGLSFSMDERTGDPVHDIIVDIFDNEKLGSDAVVTVLSVNFTKPISVGESDSELTFEAKERNFSIIPENEGGEAEVYSYNGTMRAQGATRHGVATFSTTGPIDNLEECTFIEMEVE